MKVQERAAQIWPLLSSAASSRYMVSYGIVGKLIGVSQYALSQILELIQSYCILKDLLPITVIIFNKTGEPGVGFIAASDVPLAQQKVFEYPWVDSKTATVDELLEAVQKYPSCGFPVAVEPDKVR
ncbi:hypothetical protein [Photobacterium sp. 53610]|uniref:hypothetical protein n=1 Tax=Photobacterium sp. 53610 TaxID=3102789 RepID=UPI002ED82A92